MNNHLIFNRFIFVDSILPGLTISTLYYTKILFMCWRMYFFATNISKININQH